jgi:hypothetical protein
MANIDKVNLETMVEDEEKRSETTKKFVTEWDNNQRTAVVRRYKDVVHKLVEIEEKIGVAEYEDDEMTEYLNKF